MADDRDQDWCSINEAARRLGVTPTAIRNRVKRGTLKTRPNGNYGHLVHVPRPQVPLTVSEPVSPTVPPTVPEPVTPTVTDTLIAELRERLAGMEARTIELRADVERERSERVQERERADHLASEVADMARQLARTIEEAGAREREITEKLAQARAELAARQAQRSWWRRLTG